MTRMRMGVVWEVTHAWARRCRKIIFANQMIFLDQGWGVEKIRREVKEQQLSFYKHDCGYNQTAGERVFKNSRKCGNRHLENTSPLQGERDESFGGVTDLLSVEEVLWQNDLYAE